MGERMVKVGGIARSAIGRLHTSRKAIVARYRLIAHRVMQAWQRSTIYARAHLVDLCATLSLTILIVRLILESTPEIFPDGARIGQLFNDLALAYLAAWIFNLLVIVLPRRQEKRRIYTAVSWRVPLIAEAGTHFIGVLAGNGGIARSNYEYASYTREEINHACSVTFPNEFRGPAQLGITWYAYLRHQVARSREQFRDLVPYLTFFDAELQAAINAVINSQLAMLTDDLPQIGNGTFSNLSDLIFDHWQACRKLINLYDETVRPLLIETAQRQA